MERIENLWTLAINENLKEKKNANWTASKLEDSFGVPQKKNFKFLGKVVKEGKDSIFFAFKMSQKVAK